MGSSGASLKEIEDVYRRRAPEFFRLAYAHLGFPEAARDAVQEGFANAVRGRASFRREGQVDAWVARCVINAALDAGRDPMGGGTVGPEDDGDELSREGDAPALRAAIRRLPPRQRDALFLRHYLDFEYAAIADALGIEVGTVSATLHAARRTTAHGYPSWISGVVVSSATHVVLRWPARAAQPGLPSSPRVVVREATFPAPVAGYHVRIFATPVPKELPFQRVPLASSITGTNRRGIVVACYSLATGEPGAGSPLSSCKP